MTDKRCDVLIDDDDLIFDDNEDLTLAYGLAVIRQNLRNQLIEDGRIFDIIKAPKDKVPEILDYCVQILESNEDTVEQTFSWMRDGKGVVFSGKLNNGATVDLPWTEDDNS